MGQDQQSNFNMLFERHQAQTAQLRRVRMTAWFFGVCSVFFAGWVMVLEWRVEHNVAAPASVVRADSPTAPITVAAPPVAIAERNATIIPQADWALNLDAFKAPDPIFSNWRIKSEDDKIDGLIYTITQHARIADPRPGRENTREEDGMALFATLIIRQTDRLEIYITPSAVIDGGFSEEGLTKIRFDTNNPGRIQLQKGTNGSLFFDKEDIQPVLSMMTNSSTMYLRAYSKNGDIYDLAFDMAGLNKLVKR